MQSPINLISYCAGPHSIREANDFKDFHAHAFSSINVIDDCYEGKPLNSCKLKAAKFVLGRAQSGQHGTYILCDIDTRILRLRGLNDLIKDRDAAFFFRHASPLHLGILSGFIILNVNSNNQKIIQKFLANWIEQYETQSCDWYSDQRSLILAIYMSEIANGFKVNDLSRFKNKLSFNWSTTSSILTDAVTHKGEDIYLIFKVTYSFRWLAVALDHALVIYNVAGRLLRRVLRYNNI